MKTTQAGLALITSANAYTVVHIDASWDGYRKAVAEQIDELRRRNFPGVAFVYIDCDDEVDYANHISLRNTPAVAYYRGSLLVSVVIGIGQNIVSNLSIVMEGGTPDSSNLLSRK